MYSLPEITATPFSILASAHRHGLNEYEYLLDVIGVLCDLPSPAAIGDLLPDRWQQRSAR